MKNKLAIAIVAIVAFLCFTAIPASAQNSTRGEFTLIGATVPVSTTTNNYTGTPVTLIPGYVMSVTPVCRGTNSSCAAAVTYLFNVSLDGTNYTTTSPLRATNTLSGTNTIIGFQALNSAVTKQALKIRLDGIINADTNSTVTTSKVIFRQFPE